MRFEDLTNMRFGNWTAVRRAISNNKSNHTRWVCFCDCGKAVEVLSSTLKSGRLGRGWSEIDALTTPVSGENKEAN